VVGAFIVKPEFCFHRTLEQSVQHLVGLLGIGFGTIQAATWETLATSSPVTSFTIQRAITSLADGVDQDLAQSVRRQQPFAFAVTIEMALGFWAARTLMVIFSTQTLALNRVFVQNHLARCAVGSQVGIEK
jgi:hypothetical protein